MTRLAASPLGSRAADRLGGVLADAVGRGVVPGVVAAVTDRGGIVYEAAAGVRRIGAAEPMETDAVFQVASMTKALTSVCAMQLVERGVLDLTRPISTWDPEAANFQVLGGWENGEPWLRPPRREITLLDLLTHTSGLVYRNWDPAFAKFADHKRLPGLFSGEPSAWFPPLMFDPGERWEYGISTDWVGRLVETVTDRSLGDYMAANVLGPLGMVDTTYLPRPDMARRQAALHERPAGEGLQPAPESPPWTSARTHGGAGLYSTSRDYLSFLQMWLNGGQGPDGPVLRPATVERMSRNAIGDLELPRLTTTDPARQLDIDFFPGVTKRWGLGLMINETAAPTGRPAGSLAWSGIYNTHFWIDQQTGIAGVYMTQVLPFADEQVMSAYLGFETEVYRQLALAARGSGDGE